jgi:hypothetical protein
MFTSVIYRHGRLFSQGHRVVIWIQKSKFKNAPARPRISPAKISEYLASFSSVVAYVTG